MPTFPTPICISNPFAVKNRLLIGIGLENTYGKEQSELSSILYLGDNPMLVPSFDVLNFQEARLAKTDQHFVPGGIYNLNGQCFLYGLNNATPNWTQILEIGGLIKKYDDVPTFVAGPEKSATVCFSYKNLLQIITGAKSTWGISAQVGQPITLSFAISGLYNQNRSDNPSLPVETNRIVPIFKNSTIVIESKNVSVKLPVLGFAIATNRTLQERKEAFNNKSLSEIFLSYPIDFTWEFTLEMNRSIDWIDLMQKEEKFQLNLSIPVGDKTLKMYTPDYTAKIKTSPTPGSQNKIMNQVIQFGLHGEGNFELQYV